MTRQAYYSRDALLSWLRSNTNDLRIGRALVATDAGTKRVCFARYTFAGELFEFESDAEDADEQIVRDAAEGMRAAMRLPPLFTATRSTALEQDILRASMSGRPEEAERLAQALVLENAQNVRGLYGQTAFNKRQVW